jgi:myo-inosose-2 dehydratase
MIKVGVNPIAWANGDFPELGGGVALSRCLSEIRQAGYAGTELGHGFPTEPAVLRRELEAHGLELISGWYPSYLLARGAEREERTFGEFAAFLAKVGGRYAVVAECTRCVQRERDEALRFRLGPSVLSASEWQRLARGIERLAAIAMRHGVQLVYHPHMGTVIQDEEQVSELIGRTSEQVRLTADTGHIRFAGDDPAVFFETFLDRIGLVHLKDVRAPVVERFTKSPSSFYEAVVAGVFTVPGDGDLDFTKVFDVLRRGRYEGWLVVEAEQDPKKADPLVYSTKGREAVRSSMGV